jgi:diaminopimelate epimerase
LGGAGIAPVAPTVRIGQSSWAALAALEIPNPHVVVRLPDAAAVAALDLSSAPVVDPPLPSGQNVEFVALAGPRRLAMRVYERGVGETLSCGTGICAAAVAMAAAQGGEPGGEPWLVDVPGGTCEVALVGGGAVELTGPAVLVAELSIDPDWLGLAG